MGCAVVQVLFEAKILGHVGRWGGVPAFDRCACAWSWAPPGSTEMSGSPGRGGCIRQSCWLFCPFPRWAAEKSRSGGGDTCLLDESWGLHHWSLGQLLPPAECGGRVGGRWSGVGARPGYCLVCRSPICFLGKGQCFLGHVGLGRACMDGPASSGCLPVSLGWLWTTPAVWAIVTLRSAMVWWGHCMAPTPALQPGLGGPQGSPSPEEGQVICGVSPSVYTMS